jgi:polysaccharide export outer membrane protein
MYILLKMRCDRDTIWALMLAACYVVAGTMGASAQQLPFVWVDQYKDPQPLPTPGSYVIGVGDELNIQVWEVEKMSAHVRVRSDGNVSLPFLRDVPAAGMTPVALATDLETRLKEIIVSPQVTVAVEAAKPLSVSVLGQVGQPGLHNLDPGSGVAQALAAAGGLRDFAHKDRIFVLRTGVVPIRIRMTYEAIVTGQGRAATFRLRTGDVVVVE